MLLTVHLNLVGQFLGLLHEATVMVCVRSTNPNKHYIFVAKTANERANLLIEIEVLAVYTTTYMVGVVEAAPVPTTTPPPPSRCPSSPATTAGWATARLTTSSFYMRVSSILSVYAIQSYSSRDCE
jgi:hypothetical protein